MAPVFASGPSAAHDRLAVVECRTRTVSKVGKCRIEHCTCGVVHMSVGGTTIRVNPDTACDLHSALATLVAELERKGETSAADAAKPVGQRRSRRADVSVHEQGPGQNGNEERDDEQAASDERLPVKGKTVIH